MIGTTLSHYRIVSELGKGGMGVVYKAEDTKLNRTVALKLLAPHMLASESDRSRFHREARAAAALHHPHIATVFEIDETEDGRPFIAMEYIEGAQLDEGLAERPLPVQRAVAIATQMAEALKAAHERGIVHRDIKSANVMLTKDGTAKVLDFGLAKTDASTKLTQMGSTVGTIAYMSPEQARGEEVDHRTDLWSLGAVLYEMLTGQLPFPGAYEQAVVYGILNAEPQPVTGLRSGVLMALEHVVTKCLRKEARHRYQTAADLIADLEGLDLAATTTRIRPTAQHRSRLSAAIVAPLLMLGALVGALAVWLAGPSPEAQSVVHAALPLPDSVIFQNPVWSPDGKRVLLTARHGFDTPFFVTEYSLESGELVQMTPENGSTGEGYTPDGMAFLIGRERSLFKLGRDGSLSAPLVPYPSTELDWVSERLLVVASFQGLRFVDPDIPGTDTLIYPLGFAREPVVSPDRKTLFFSHFDSELGRVIPGAFDLGESTRLPDYDDSPGRMILAYREEIGLITKGPRRGPVGVLPIDPRSKQPLGPEQRFFMAGQAAVSQQGHLAYSVPPLETPPPLGEALYLVSGEDGSATPLSGQEDIGQSQYNDFSVSPDGSAYVIEVSGRLALVRPSAGSAITLPPEGRRSRHPFWSPGSEWIYYQSYRDSVWAIERIRSDGSEPEIVVASGPEVSHPSVTQDDRTLVYREVSPQTEGDIWAMDLETGERSPVLVANGNQGLPSISPFGGWVGYTSGGNVMIASRNGRETALVAEAGGRSGWARDGKTLYYEKRAGPNGLVARTFDDSPGIPLSQRLGEERLIRSFRVHHIHWSPTASGNLVVSLPGTLEEEFAGPIRIILNWTASLK